MNPALSSAAPDDHCDAEATVPMKPHTYPIWLVAVAFLVASSVAYSAVLVPPYFGAYVSLRHAEAALEKGERPA